jgi:hypothetical protein
MLTARRAQETHDPVILHAFGLPGVLILYPQNLRRVVTVVGRRHECRGPVPRMRTGTKNLT